VTLTWAFPTIGSSTPTTAGWTATPLHDGAYEAVASGESPATVDLENWPGLTIDLGAIWR
jgi:hypothetical protein